MQNQSTLAGLFPLLKYNRSTRSHAESEHSAICSGQVMAILFRLLTHKISCFIHCFSIYLRQRKDN